MPPITAPSKGRISRPIARASAQPAMNPVTPKNATIARMAHTSEGSMASLASVENMATAMIAHPYSPPSIAPPPCTTARCARRRPRATPMVTVRRLAAWSSRLPGFASGRAGGVHADVVQRTGEPGEDAGHRWGPERRPQVPERLAGGANELARSTGLRRPVVKPVEDDGEVQSVEDAPQLHCLLLSGGVASAPHDLKEDTNHLLAHRSCAFAESREPGVGVERAGEEGGQGTAMGGYLIQHGEHRCLEPLRHRPPSQPIPGPLLGLLSQPHVP